MTLKISFESDIKGFERVERALKSQQDILNQNADAVERLQKAQQGLSKESTDIKGMEGLRATSNQIKDLTGALDQLVKSQSGLKGFMNIFGDFGREIGKLRMESGTQIFKSMGDQIEALKNNMRGTSEMMSRLRTEIDTAKAEGRADDAQAASEQLRGLTVSQMGQTSLLRGLQWDRFKHKEILAPGGAGGAMIPGGGLGQFLLGGTSLARLGMIGGGIGAAIYGSAAAARWGLAVSETGMREDMSLYRRRMDILRSGAAGDPGRKIMLDLGAGYESDYMSTVGKGRVFTDAQGRLRAQTYFDFQSTIATLIIENIRNLLSGGFVGWGDAVATEATRRSGFDVKEKEAFQGMAGFIRQLGVSPEMAEMEMMLGRTGAYGALGRGIGTVRTRDGRVIAGSGITMEQFLPAAQFIGRYQGQDIDAFGAGRKDFIRDTEERLSAGRIELARADDNRKNKEQELRKAQAFVSEMTEKGYARDPVRAETYEAYIQKSKQALKEAQDAMSDAERRQSQLESQRYYGDVGALMRDPQLYGYTPASQRELLRQVVMRGGTRRGASPEERQRIIESVQGQVGQIRYRLGDKAMDVFATQVFTDYGAQVMSNIQYPVTMQESMGGAMAAFGAVAPGGEVPQHLTGAEVAGMSATAQGQIGQSINKGNTGLFYEVYTALMRMGITNMAQAGQLAQAWANPGRRQWVAAVVSKMSNGKYSEEDVISEIQGGTTRHMNRLKKFIYGNNERLQQVEEEIAKDPRFGPTAPSLGSYAVSGLDAKGGALAFNAYIAAGSAGAEPTTPMGPTAPGFVVDTTKQQVQELPADQQAEMLRSVNETLKTVGVDLGRLVVGSIASSMEGAAKEMRTNLKGYIDELDRRGALGTNKGVSGVKEDIGGVDDIGGFVDKVRRGGDY